MNDNLLIFKTGRIYNIIHRTVKINYHEEKMYFSFDILKY